MLLRMAERRTTVDPSSAPKDGRQRRRPTDDRKGISDGNLDMLFGAEAVRSSLSPLLPLELKARQGNKSQALHQPKEAMERPTPTMRNGETRFASHFPSIERPIDGLLQILKVI